jgi:hypothetical protein
VFRHPHYRESSSGHPRPVRTRSRHPAEPQAFWTPSRLLKRSLLSSSGKPNEQVHALNTQGKKNHPPLIVLFLPELGSFQVVMEGARAVRETVGWLCGQVLRRLGPQERVHLLRAARHRRHQRTVSAPNSSSSIAFSERLLARSEPLKRSANCLASIQARFENFYQDLLIITRCLEV